jgi:hypothetical protein
LLRIVLASGDAVCSDCRDVWFEYITSGGSGDAHKRYVML